MIDHGMLSYEIRVTDLDATLDRIERDGKKVKLYLKDLRYDDGFELLEPSWNARLSAFVSMIPEAGIIPGSRVRIPRATLTPLPLPVVPGGYDFAFFMYFKRIGAIGFLTSRVEVIQAAPGGFIDRWREAAFQRIAGNNPSPESAVGAALFTGERGMIPEEHVEAMRRAGLAHLLAISGMHVGIVTGLCFLVFRRGLACVPALANRYDIRRPSALLALAGAGFYVAMTGAPVSAQRAFVMAALFLLGLVFYRRASALQSAALAALVMCVISPHITVHPGFRMSFCAVIAIIAMFSHLERYKRTKTRTNHRHDGNIFARIYVCGKTSLLYVGYAGLSSLAATVATTPFSVYHFHQFTLQGIWTNLIAMPLTSLWIMPAGTLGLLLMPIGWDGLPLHISTEGVKQLLQLADMAASADIGVFVPTSPSGLALFLWVAAVMTGFLLHGNMRYISLICAAAAAFFYNKTPVPDIFISDNTKIFAVVSGDILVVNDLRSGRYARQRWQEAAGTHQTIRHHHVKHDIGLTCDTTRRCVYRHSYGTVIFSDDQSYLDKYQDTADAVVLLQPDIHSTAPLVVPYDALKAAGTHVITFHPDQTLHIVSAGEICPAGCPWRNH